MNHDNSNNEDKEKENNLPPSNLPILSDPKELFKYGICKVPIPKCIDCNKWSKELITITPLIMAGEGDGEYAFYRNILEEPDFPFHSLLKTPTEENSNSSDTLTSIGKAILDNFDNISNLMTDIRLDDAFCIHYNDEQIDTSGAKHVDPCDITVNMCIQKSNTTKGSQVLFYGSRKLKKQQTAFENEEEEIEKEAKEEDREELVERFLVDQEEGYATIHWGNHPHETLPLVRNGGTRTNIVLTYCYVDESKSDVSMRSCYNV